MFNGALISVNGQLCLFPRIQTAKQEAGVVDIPACIGVYHVYPQTWAAEQVNSIPVEVLQGNMQKIFPEDLRGIVIDPTGTIMFGLTAADVKGNPHAAILTAKPPFKPEDFSPMEVLTDLPLMKNIMPLSPTVIAGRPEIARGNKHTILFATKNEDSKKWQITGSTTFPDVPWVGENGNFGLVGWNERVPIPGKPGYFRFLVHGCKKENDIAEYAIGLAEAYERPDKTFTIIAVDKKPLLTYKEATRGIVGHEPDPHKRVIYSVGGVVTDDEVKLPVTLFDNQIHLFGIPRAEMLRVFSQ